MMMDMGVIRENMQGGNGAHVPLMAPMSHSRSQTRQAKRNADDRTKPTRTGQQCGALTH